MRYLHTKLPSPAMGVAFVALLAALTGTAVALPGNNSVTSGDIRNGQVKTQDIKNNNVRGKDVRNSTLTGSDVRNNSLSGADVNEGSLGTVPRANVAGAAAVAGTAFNANTVGGRSVQRIARFVPDDSPSTTVLNINGLQLGGTCDGNDWDFNGTTTLDESSLYYWAIDTDADTVGGDDFESNDFDIGDEADIDAEAGNGDADTDQGQIDYIQPNNSTGVNVQFILDEIDGGCLFVGTVIS